ncbi:hypothetical protein PV04_07402 [Phialophora macrospora]|uniref:BAH domain-containing protein n=1 Tax=Phialophora macrospora TaxID=1851006 RepID=A0A0D2FZ14_9EURO|nr:hypothetical protein PV04_07402 [Phialophora macrospora]
MLPLPPQMAGRKRKASEGDYRRTGQQPHLQHSSGNTSRVHLDSSRPRMRDEALNTDDPEEETIETEGNGETTITVDCPVWPKSRKCLARSKQEDLWIESDAPPGAPELKVHYSVSPGSFWLELREYQRARFKEPVEVMYSAGQYIYVNHCLPVPAPPAANASARERLAYDKANLWVARVSEIRAVSRTEIFVRVFWLYWPDELPSGRRPYHGEGELVMSNHVSIIKADTIACPADVSHWDENDDSNQKVLSERYWRQTFDVTKVDRLALSKLRKFCVCRRYDDPNIDLFQCKVAGCATWNHEDCLIADIEKRAWAKFIAGELGHETQQTENEKTFGQKVAEKVGHNIVGDGIDIPELEDEAPSNRIPTSSRRTKPVAGHRMPWTHKLEGRITKVPKAGDETTLRATIRQKVPTSEASANANASFEPQVWTVKLKCLKCRHSLN